MPLGDAFALRKQHFVSVLVIEFEHSAPVCQRVLRLDQGLLGLLSDGRAFVASGLRGLYLLHIRNSRPAPGLRWCWSAMRDKPVQENNASFGLATPNCECRCEDDIVL